jgi:YHS domain-containing protein/plastocyanin
MQVDEEEAAGQSEYKGNTYYFCALSCKTQFDEDPARYAEQGRSAGRRNKRKDGSRDRGSRIRVSPWLIVMPVVAIVAALVAALVLTPAPSGTTEPASEVAGQASTVSFTIEAGDDGTGNNSFFDPETIRANAGDTIELVVTNPGSVSHNLRLSGIDRQYGTGDDFESEPFAIGPGETGRAVVKIESPGTYPFRCDFHPALQIGTLVLS